MIKKIIYFLFLIGTFQCSFAQSFELYGGLNFGSFHNKSFNSFVDSYNEYNAPLGSMQKELNPFYLCRGYNFGIAIYPFDEINLGFSYNVMRLRAHTVAEYSIGKRHIEQLVRTPCNFGFPFKLGPVVVHPKFGVTNSDFLVYYEYNDGTKSYGGEKLLNGKYSGFGFIGELSLELNLTPFDGPVSVCIGGSLTGCTGIVENNEGNWSRGLAGSYYPSGLPLDYSAWQTTANNGNYTDYNDGYASGKFFSLNAFINLKFRIGND